MRDSHRPADLLLASLLVAGLCGACSTRGQDTGQPTEQGGGAAASCAAPYLDADPPGTTTSASTVTLVAPGDSVTVFGHWYTSTCNDTGLHDPLEPLPPVHLTLTFPSGRATDLGVFTPSGPDLGFTATFRIPPGTRPGLVRISDDQEHPSVYKVRVADSVVK